MILIPVLLASTCVAVAGEKIAVGDLAKALPVFAPAPAEEPVAIAPYPGVRRVLGMRELEPLAARYAVSLPPASSACFERATGPLEEERIAAALARALRNEKGTWQVLEASRYPVPEGVLEFTPPPAIAAGAPVLIRGRIQYAPGRSFPVWVRVKVARPPRDVERGDLVSVEVSSGGALLKFEARAESAGETGQSVVVRNPISKVCFSARVTGPRKVFLDATNDAGPAIRSGARPGRREPGR